MKKLLSLVLCVALLTGVCAAALAERNGLTKMLGASYYRKNLKILSDCLDRASAEADTKKWGFTQRIVMFRASNKPLIDAFNAYKDKDSRLKEILKASDIDADSYAAGLEAAKEAIELKNVLYDYADGNKIYKSSVDTMKMLGEYAKKDIYGFSKTLTESVSGSIALILESLSDLEEAYKRIQKSEPNAQ